MSFANHVSCIYVDSMNTDLYVFTSWNHQSKSMDWFLCDNDLRHERVNSFIKFDILMFCGKWRNFIFFRRMRGNTKMRRDIIQKSSAIRLKDESQYLCYKKTKHVKFSEKRTFLTPWYAWYAYAFMSEVTTNREITSSRSSQLFLI